MSQADEVAFALVADVPAQEERLLARVPQEGDAVGLEEVGDGARFLEAAGGVVGGCDDLGEREWVGEDMLFGCAGAWDMFGWVGVGVDVDLVGDARGPDGFAQGFEEGAAVGGLLGEGGGVVEELA